MPENNTVQRYLDHTFSLRQALGWCGIVLLIALLGAHFYRALDYGLTVCCLGIFLLHCGRAEWKPYAVSFFLLWGAVEWGTTALLLLQARVEAGFPWLRAALIFWGVICLTCIGSKALSDRSSRQEARDKQARLKALVFFSSFCGMYYVAKYAPLPLLLLERFSPRWGAAQIICLAWYSVFVMTLLLDKKRSRAGRKRVWLIFSLLFFSQLVLGILGIEQMLMTGKLHIPLPGFIVFGPIFRETANMMIGLALAATLLTGSAWCSMLCYFGPFDSSVAGNQSVKPIPPVLQWMVRYGRVCILIAGSLIAAVLGRMDYPMERAWAASLFFVAASVLVLGTASRRHKSMIHCTAFCPMGIVINLLGRISPWRIRVDPKKCDHCGACEAVCKYRAISVSSRKGGKTKLPCSLCLDCVPVCKKQAISIQAVGTPLTALTAKYAFLLLLVTIHVMFLAFARV